MKRLLFAAAVLVASLSSGVAVGQVDFFYSTSSVDALAGNILEMELGETASMYVWLTNNDVGVIDGVGIDLLSSDPNILEGTAHTINEPGSRWTAINEGVLGDLNTGSVAFGLVGFGADGIANDNTPTLYSEIQFLATAEGSTDLTIAENSNAISVSGSAPQSVTFGTATVNVVPEPTAVVVLSLVGIGMMSKRRRKTA